MCCTVILICLGVSFEMKQKSSSTDVHDADFQRKFKAGKYLFQSLIFHTAPIPTDNNCCFCFALIRESRTAFTTCVRVMESVITVCLLFFFNSEQLWRKNLNLDYYLSVTDILSSSVLSYFVIIAATIDWFKRSMVHVKGQHALSLKMNCCRKYLQREA